VSVDTSWLLAVLVVLDACINPDVQSGTVQLKLVSPITELVVCGEALAVMSGPLDVLKFAG